MLGSWFNEMLVRLGLRSQPEPLPFGIGRVRDTRLVQQLRAWESDLTPSEKQAAFSYVLAHGWHPGSEPPPYVWAQAYLAVAPGKMPPAPSLH